MSSQSTIPAALDNNPDVAPPHVTRFVFPKESTQELIFLIGLATYLPFMTPGRDEWNKLVDHLHETDRIERPTTPFFTNVTVRSCEVAWERLCNEQRAYEEAILAATSIAPQETTRRRLMKELFCMDENR